MTAAKRDPKDKDRELRDPPEKMLKARPENKKEKESKAGKAELKKETPRKDKGEMKNADDCGSKAYDKYKKMKK